MQIAKERNINYKPSPEAYSELMSYIDRRGIDNPYGGNGQGGSGGGGGGGMVVGPPP